MMVGKPISLLFILAQNYLTLQTTLNFITQKEGNHFTIFNRKIFINQQVHLFYNFNS